MERVGALIHKLKDQYDQNVDKKSLLVTVQLLLAELEEGATHNHSREKVSVILPKVHRIQQDLPSIDVPVENTAVNLAPVEPEGKAEVPPVTEQPAPQEKKPEAAPPVDKPSLPETIRSYVLKPPTQTVPPVKQQPEPSVQMPDNVREEKPVEPVKPEPPKVEIKQEPVPAKNDRKQQAGSLFDGIDDVPTIAQHKQQQKEVYELNDVHIDGNSLNEKLKEEKTEVAATIKGDPVHDLRRAVGINDRYRFINELFRGDEDMYERSIKTINAFGSIAEAETWIQRELKVKIGWNDNSQTVKDFDHVVKRRFS